MSDVFDDTLSAAAESFFLLPGSETVTYYPAVGAGRRINAVVSRGEPGGVPDIRGDSFQRPAILVRNDATKGIASDTVDCGGDEIEVARRVGNAPKRLRIMEILNQDAGLMLLVAGLTFVICDLRSGKC